MKDIDPCGQRACRFPGPEAQRKQQAVEEVRGRNQKHIHAVVALKRKVAQEKGLRRHQGKGHRQADGAECRTALVFPTAQHGAQNQKHRR